MSGIAGVAGHTDAGKLVYLMLYALQHRGQEQAGIASTDHAEIHKKADSGYVRDIFDEYSLAKLIGDKAVGYVGSSTMESRVQPFLVKKSNWGAMSIVCDGNIPNAQMIRSHLVEEGFFFQTTSDTEVIAHLLARSDELDLVSALQSVFGSLEEAGFSLIIQTRLHTYALRDPRGYRTLSMGLLDGASVFASETCAFDLIEAEFVRDIFPGEIFKVSNGEVATEESLNLPVKSSKRCIFEYIYLTRPDSLINGCSVTDSRIQMGEKLFVECPVSADVVVPVLSSGLNAAIGFAEKSDLPLHMGLVRNHYVGPTLYGLGHNSSSFQTRAKFNADRSVVHGQRVVVVDDSILRGRTIGEIVEMVRKAGAIQVHVRISSPPFLHPCHWGVDTPPKDQLISGHMSSDELCERIRADSLGFLSIDGLLESVQASASQSFCTYCFTGA